MESDFLLKMSNRKFGKKKFKDGENLQEFLFQINCNLDKKSRPNNRKGAATHYFPQRMDTPFDDDYTDIQYENSKSKPKFYRYANKKQRHEDELECNTLIMRKIDSDNFWWQAPIFEKNSWTSASGLVKIVFGNPEEISESLLLVLRKRKVDMTQKIGNEMFANFPKLLEKNVLCQLNTKNCSWIPTYHIPSS